ncbi:ribosome-associated translation inhibitor RaiA [Candidatus Hamiltonella defensa]|uniref:Ribosomal subunit interface protein n=1 Tax=Candidatus Williamhamiltonella defendens TaxID=138072 RepID=A0AAC9VKH8_9ENTR|nr:ribosome-associated translation inhibitor RaiA [Candidatus Hamiltonella defensa]ASV33712.1 ribosomal subunit interface protein [Candidatus Hamiltonella defensa]AWK16666.1 ribosomal subunit interface protein [Candidatus Hamiltonella defensa]MBK4360774.1 ribosome-associated translation inhibitor RaiA [Candidatus Hamiltonella defensa]
MIVNITGKDIDITPSISERINERFKKLDKWKAQLIHARVVMNKARNGFKVDATIGVPHRSLFASAEDPDMYAAINEVFNKLERQLNKIQHKEESRRNIKNVKDIEYEGEGGKEEEGEE